MAKKGEVSNYKEQKTAKPQIEDVIQAVLKDDRKQAALDMAAFVKSLKMTPQWASTNSWALSYKSKRVGYIKMNEKLGDWQVFAYSQYDEHLQELLEKESDEIQAYILDNITYCYHCSACTPGKDMVLLGKDLKKICGTPSFKLQNPNELYCEFVKKLIILRRTAIENNRVPKVTYIAMKRRK